MKKDYITPLFFVIIRWFQKIWRRYPLNKWIRSRRGARVPSRGRLWSTRLSRPRWKPYCIGWISTTRNRNLGEHHINLPHMLPRSSYLGKFLPIRTPSGRNTTQLRARTSNKCASTTSGPRSPTYKEAKRGSGAAAAAMTDSQRASGALACC